MRYTITNKYTGRLISFTSETDRDTFRWNAEFIFGVDMLKDFLFEEFPPYQTNDMKFVEETGI
tara:strand:+ start:86 stop:274 length:189 start_codon:yes stop_codon:yes gene_type:complete